MSPFKYHKKDNNAGMRSSIEMQTAYIKKKYQELGACQRKQTLQKHIFIFFLEHFIQVEDKGLSCTVIHINDFLECHLDSHINLRVLLHGLVLNGADTFT